MTRLEDIRAGTSVRGLAPRGLAKIVGVEWYGDQAIKVVYEDGEGTPNSRLVYRDEESSLEVVASEGPWSFDGDGALLRLVSEADRIRLAHLFDPYLAVHTSRIEPLPHQITAVYGEMLTRQPLRYLLADDPGAGKTIMTGLLIKELMVRGDLERCLIVTPGNLVEQWQDELDSKFGLSLSILARDHNETSRIDNPFEEHSLLIARLDMLSRNEELQERLKGAAEYDLIVVDEAHKMSATYTGGEVKYTKRYYLGETLRERCRHFLAEGDDKRRVNVGFALQILQRRLASSPEAIYRSLIRRRERLERRLDEERQAGEAGRLWTGADLPELTPDYLEDLEDAPEADLTDLKAQFTDPVGFSQMASERSVVSF